MKSIFVEVEKCLGCRSCELACAVEHSSSHSLYSAISEQHLPAERISVERTVFGPFPIQCHHCEDAPCMEACISGAIQRNKVTDIVYIDEIKCVGCWMCVMVCPFGAIVPNVDRKIAYKCDLCLKNLVHTDLEMDKNSEKIACVNACPTGALVYYEPEKLLSDKRRQRAYIVSLPL